jgi:predicted PurR-regulated permease PerM
MEERHVKQKKEYLITISTGTMIRVLVVLLIIGFLFLIRDIVAMFCAALFIAALLDPFADFLERKRVPRVLAVVIVYVIGLAILAGAVVLVVPPVISQLQTFITVFAPFISEALGIQVDPSQFGQGSLVANFESVLSSVRSGGFSAAVPQIIAVGSAAFGGVTAAVLVLILALYLVAEKTALVRAISFATPEDYQPFVMQTAMKVRERLGSWLRGELMLMFAIFILTYIALSILGIPYALVLALLAGLLEVIPFIGPLLSGIPAVILALAISPFHAIATALAYLIIQVAEGNVLVPKIMQKATGINPIISLLCVLIGWRLGGMVGAILSIPLANAVSVLIAEVFRRNNSTS